MARMNLKHCTVTLKDGLSGTAAVNQSTTAPAESDTTLTVDSIQLNTNTTDLIPVGARFTIAGETQETKHIVTARVPETGGPTTSITFSPALGPGTYADDGVLTFSSQELAIKIGDGSLNYSEKTENEYLLDRGLLDTVRDGDEQPMEVNLEFVYEHITTGTSESIAPMDALKRKGAASEWVSSSADLCEPYAVDLVVTHTPPCGTSQKEVTIFPDFRSESRDVDFGEAKISISGKCNATEPITERE